MSAITLNQVLEQITKMLSHHSVVHPVSETQLRSWRDAIDAHIEMEVTIAPSLLENALITWCKAGGLKTSSTFGSERLRSALQEAMSSAMAEDIKDAKRYRWLCEFKEWPSTVYEVFDFAHKVQIDEAIDAAMSVQEDGK